MSNRSLAVGVLAAGAIAGCGSSSTPQTIGQLCSLYAGAVKQIVPSSLPPGVPQDFAAKLGAQAGRVCVNRAVALGYGRGAQDPAQVKITHARGTRLIRVLTGGTAVHVSY